MTVDSKNPAHSDKMMSLSDGLVRWEFDVLGDPPDITEEPQVPTSHIFGDAGKEFGDWEPGHSHIQQKSWIGGRASQEFVDDESRFFDSRSLWNFTPEHLHPAPQWRFAGPLDVFSENYMPASGIETIGNNVRWIRLGSTYYSRGFTAGASKTHALGQLWVRRHGSPSGNLTFELWSDDGGSPSEPNSVIKTATLDKDSFEEDISSVGEWTFSQALTSGTKYHVVVYDATGGDDFNYFEIGYSTGGDANLYFNSTDSGSSWSAESNVQLCFRLSEARWTGKIFQFDMEGPRYAITSRDDDTNSLMFINGDRGIATSATATVITDSTKSWNTSEWVGAWFRCHAGTGKGQFGQITANNGTTFTTATMDITLDNTSQYYFYATDIWTGVTPGGTDITDRVVSQPIVFDNQVLLPYGSATNMLRVKWDSGTPGHLGNPEAKKADFLSNLIHPSDGPVVVRGENDSVDLSYAAVAAWATDLSFNTEVAAGEDTALITGLSEFNGSVYVRKEDSIGIFRNDKYVKMDIGLHTMAQATNGQAAAAWNLMLYVNWAYSVEQIMGNNVDDIGPWLNAGLPAGRRGTVAAMEPTQAVMYMAVDAGSTGDRISSVLGWNKIGYGSIFEAWVKNRRVRGVKYQSCPGTQDRLWIAVDNELVVMDFPDESLNMLTDTGVNYQHEAVFESSTVDMNAHRIKKLFNSLSLTTRNLQNRVTIVAQYQVDDDIDNTAWFDIGEFNRSDFQERGIWQGNRRRIRIRLIFRTGVAATPAVLRAWVIEAYGRIPVKYQWTIRIPVKSLTISDNKVARDPDKFVKWLKFQGQNAGSLVLGSVWPDLDNVRVLVEPPSVIRLAIQRMTKAKTLQINIAIRES